MHSAEISKFIKDTLNLLTYLLRAPESAQGIRVRKEWLQSLGGKEKVGEAWENEELGV